MRSTLALSLVVMVGCAHGVEPPEPIPVTHAEVLALSTYEASVGTLIELYGRGFPETASVMSIAAVFEGVYEREDGVTEPVSLVTPVRRVDGGTLRWTAFGPHDIPFSASGTDIGTFRGTIRLRVSGADGRSADGPARPLAFTVLPSLLVRELAPLSARCSGPAARGIGGLPYRIRVEAVGFEPSTFSYVVAAPAIGFEPRGVRHLADGPGHTFGDDGSLVLPDVPVDAQAYGLAVSVEARTASGEVVQTLFAVGVHRPIEVFYNGNVEVAELYEPVPVSGCMPGGEAGREVAYTESLSETRARAFTVSWNESWFASSTVGSSTSRTRTETSQNSVSFSTTDGQSWGWTAGAEGGGSVSLFEIVELGMKANGEYREDYFSQSTAGASASEGVSRSETTTDTQSATVGAGGSRGQDFRWELSSTEELSRGFSGTIIASTYGVFYRQTLRLVRRAAVVTYNLCGAVEVVGDVELDDWAWSPDLALGSACPPLPASNLPPAQCMLEPCAGE